MARFVHWIELNLSQIKLNWIFVHFMIGASFPQGDWKWVFLVIRLTNTTTRTKLSLLKWTACPKDSSLVLMSNCCEKGISMLYDESIEWAIRSESQNYVDYWKTFPHFTPLFKKVYEISIKTKGLSSPVCEICPWTSVVCQVDPHKIFFSYFSGFGNFHYFMSCEIWGEN